MALSYHFGKSGRTLFLLQAIACSIFALNLNTQAESIQPAAQRSASATLHIHVTVVPVVQTPVRVTSSASSDSITYSMEAPPLAKTYEIRNLRPQDQDPGTKRPAVLRTLVIVTR